MPLYIIDEVASELRKIGAVLNCEEYDLENISNITTKLLRTVAELCLPNGVREELEMSHTPGEPVIFERI